MEIVRLDATRVRAHAGRAGAVALDAHASNMALGLARLTCERAAAEWRPLVARAERLGLSLLWLTTHADTPPDASYERLGWTRYPVVPGWALRPDGELVANAFFSLALPGRTTP